MDTFLQDVRYAFRTLSRSRMFALIAVACLALGIGVNTTIFSVVNAVLLRPFDFTRPRAARRARGAEHAERRPCGCRVAEPRGLARTVERVLGHRGGPGSQPDARERRRARAARGRRHHVEPVPDARRVAGASGDSSARTRTEPGGDRVVLLSDGLWERRFGRDPTIVGKTLMLNEIAAHGHRRDGPRASSFRRRASCGFRCAKPRARSGAISRDCTRSRASRRAPRSSARVRQLTQVAARLAAEYPENADWSRADRGRSARVHPRRHPAHRADDDGRGDVRAADRLRERREPDARARHVARRARSRSVRR